jgi:hypothetical protein
MQFLCNIRKALKAATALILNKALNDDDVGVSGGGG